MKKFIVLVLLAFTVAVGVSSGFSDKSEVKSVERLDALRFDSQSDVEIKVIAAYEDRYNWHAYNSYKANSTVNPAFKHGEFG